MTRTGRRRRRCSRPGETSRSRPPAAVAATMLLSSAFRILSGRMTGAWDLPLWRRDKGNMRSAGVGERDSVRRAASAHIRERLRAAAVCGGA